MFNTHQGWLERVWSDLPAPPLLHDVIEPVLDPGDVISIIHIPL